MPVVPEYEIGTITPEKVPSVKQDSRLPALNFNTSIGEGLQDLGSVLTAHAAQLKQDEAETRAKELDKAFADGIRGLLNDPETGYYNTAGKTAYERYDKVRKDLEALHRKLSSGLKAGSMEAQLFEQVARRRMEMAMDGISKHAGKGFRHWQVETGKARMASAMEDAADNWTDPKLVQLAVGTGLDELRQLGERLGWSPEQLQQAEMEYTSTLHTRVIDRIAATGDLQAAKAYFDQHRDQLIGEQQTQIMETLRHADDHAKARQASDLELSVLRGDATAGQVDAAFEAGVITGPKRTELLATLQKKREAAAQQAQADNWVDRLRTTGLPVDPGNPKHRAAVEGYYRRRIATLPPDRQLQEGFALATDTGYLVPELRSQLVQAATSGNGQLIQAAVQEYDALKDARPDLVEQVPSQARRVLDAVDGLVRAGVPLQQATATVLKNARIDKETEAALRKTYAQEATPTTLREELQDLADSDDTFDTHVIGGAPAVGGQMLVDYDRARWQFWLLTRDHAKASGLAWNAVRSIYATTEVGSAAARAHGLPERRLLRYPPEAIYQATPEQLDKDLASFARGHGLKPEEVWFTSDAITAREPGRAKTYPVYRINDFGAPVPVYDRLNQPLRWHPQVDRNRVDERAQSLREEAAAFDERVLRDGPTLPPRPGMIPPDAGTYQPPPGIPVIHIDTTAGGR